MQRRDEPRSWGPNISRIPAGAGLGGMFIAVLLMIGVMIAVPAARLWLYISVPVGLAVALILYLARR
jgi:hypothetical protein